MIRALGVCLAFVLPVTAQADVILTQAEIDLAFAHGPWAPEIAADPSNRVSGDPDAIAFGETLFHSVDLSQDGSMSCASCHDPELGFSDGLKRAVGRVQLDRNTQSLWNLSQHRWFGWAGSTDSIWAHSIRPLLHPDEMGQSPQIVQHAMTHGPLADGYADIFGTAKDQDATEVLVNAAKALAAYQETLVTGATPFDAFLNAIEAKDWRAAAQYPEAAQRGWQIFAGRGKCTFCHVGPAFTNQEFHDAGVPYFITDTRVDQGRFQGLQDVLASPFNLAGDYSDDPDKIGAWAVETVRPLHSDFGIFRVPSLRNVALTAPYMHDGSLPDLTSVVQHYNTINLERLHADGEAILEPLGLTPKEVADVVAFLESLTEIPD